MSASWAATPPIVGMRCSAMVRSASAARHRPRMWVRDARRRYQGSLVVMPMWANWVDASIAGPACPGWAQAPPVSATATASSWRSQNTAPFGSPVVPEVNTMATGRSGSSGSTGGAPPDDTSAAPSAASAATSPGSDSTTAGSARATSASCSGGASRGLMPAVIAPSLAAAA